MRGFFQFFLVLLIVAVLVGCGASTPTQPPQPTDTDTPVAVAQATATAIPIPTATETAQPSPTASATATSTPSTTPTPVPSPTTSPTMTPAPTNTATEAVPTTDATRAAELYELGLEVYREQFCGTCHSLDAAGTGGIFGPPHDEMGTVARERILDPDYSGSATTAAEYIVESIVEPQVYIVPGFATTSHHMPPYEHLSEEAILALVELLLQQE